MTRIVFTRHGLPVWPPERYAGSSNIELSDEGRIQATRLAEWATGAGLSGDLVQSARRARDTAEIVADAVGLPVTVDARLTELDFGVGEGLTSEEMRERFPIERRAFELDPALNPLPGAEHAHLAAQRMHEAVIDIEAAAGEDRVLVVSHSTVIRLLVCQLLGLPLREYRRRMPWHGYTMLTEIRFTDGDGALLSFNAPPERAGPECSSPCAGRR